MKLPACTCTCHLLFSFSSRFLLFLLYGCSLNQLQHVFSFITPLHFNTLETSIAQLTSSYGCHITMYNINLFNLLQSCNYSFHFCYQYTCIVFLQVFLTFLSLNANKNRLSNIDHSALIKPTSLAGKNEWSTCKVTRTKQCQSYCTITTIALFLLLVGAGLGVCGRGWGPLS